MSRPTPDRASGRAETGLDRPVTIAAFSEPIEAHLARSRLECEGIGCTLADEHIVGVYWLSASAVGGVKLQVRERDREHALRVLEETSARPASSAEWVTGDLDAPRCPSCGSLRVDRERFDRRRAWWAEERPTFEAALGLSANALRKRIKRREEP